MLFLTIKPKNEKVSIFITSMKLLNIFKRKRWRCLKCQSPEGGHPVMEVIWDVDVPHDYLEDRRNDVKYKLLRCPQCGKYAVVGPHPIICHCGAERRGVLRTGNTDYSGCRIRSYTPPKSGELLLYCRQCECSMDGPIYKDDKGAYIQLRSYNASGQEVDAGKTRVTLLPTLFYREVELK